MGVQNAGIFQNIVIRRKVLPKIKETCILETQGNSQELNMFFLVWIRIVRQEF